MEPKRDGPGQDVAAVLLEAHPLTDEIAGRQMLRHQRPMGGHDQPNTRRGAS
jgi:hypothetical protein